MSGRASESIVTPVVEGDYASTREGNLVGKATFLFWRGEQLTAGASRDFIVQPRVNLRLEQLEFYPLHPDPDYDAVDGLVLESFKLDGQELLVGALTTAEAARVWFCLESPAASLVALRLRNPYRSKRVGVGVRSLVRFVYQRCS